MNAEMDLVNVAVDEARSKGAAYAEARYEKQDPENFILKNGVLDALYVGHDQGIGVRVLVNGALGFAATNSLSKAGVRAIVGDAIKIAKASRRKTKITFAQEDSIAMNWSIPEAKKITDVSVEENTPNTPPPTPPHPPPPHPPPPPPPPCSTAHHTHPTPNPPLPPLHLPPPHPNTPLLTLSHPSLPPIPPPPPPPNTLLNITHPLTPPPSPPP